MLSLINRLGKRTIIALGAHKNILIIVFAIIPFLIVPSKILFLL